MPSNDMETLGSSDDLVSRRASPKEFEKVPKPSPVPNPGVLPKPHATTLDGFRKVSTLLWRERLLPCQARAF